MLKPWIAEETRMVVYFSTAIFMVVWTFGPLYGFNLPLDRSGFLGAVDAFLAALVIERSKEILDWNWKRAVPWFSAVIVCMICSYYLLRGYDLRSFLHVPLVTSFGVAFFLCARALERKSAGDPHDSDSPRSS